jgi:hypothetical protein
MRGGMSRKTKYEHYLQKAFSRCSSVSAYWRISVSLGVALFATVPSTGAAKVEESATARDKSRVKIILDAGSVFCRDLCRWKRD